MQYSNSKALYYNTIKNVLLKLVLLKLKTRSIRNTPTQGVSREYITIQIMIITLIIQLVVVVE